MQGVVAVEDAVYASVEVLLTDLLAVVTYSQSLEKSALTSALA